ncbi:uncharacterized protein MELLADRAFT_112212 [Melampsora larici-populina 98AG31]|uniref:Uncharacterized protein n=1 Tax=Melampsora larici-populina (strain 98AG31 / pathotype 3-4-7) TaxID=747676 RepID=F4S5R0_MELLP|nr:uncharacterized protein MELLADRAFT_112212 [Melampsora larici-populina 98AG31]EGF99942.1 hypothetical protein MELLADRAFT_112212 [Melampsora larici-populina 98AG31]
MDPPLVVPAQSECALSGPPDLDATVTATSQSEFFYDSEVGPTKTALGTSPSEYVSDSQPESHPVESESPESDASDYISDVVIPASELEREDHIANITDAIIAEGMSLREFIMAVKDWTQ